MEKLHRKWKGIPVGIIALAMIVVVAVSAAGWIFSNIVTVHVTPKPPVPVYALTLNQPADVWLGDSIVFTGSLMDTANSVPVAGAAIEIMDMSSALTVATATTGADGTFISTPYTPTAAGTYEFRAKYNAP